MTTPQTLRLCADVTEAPTQDAMVLLDGREGCYWQLNATGALMLRALLDGMPRERVAERVAQTHPVTAERAAADIDDLIGQLVRARLVEGVPTA